MSRLPPSPQGYRLLAPIARGGMAEVYLAERAGAEGVATIVALKWLLPHLAEDDALVRAFLDEARLTVDLSHENLVRVIELGRTERQYFLAMEYVRGWSFAKVLGAAAARGSPLPPALAAFVGAEVLRGLAHAHERADREGRPLGIVHRDVSPANILVSTAGQVKLADFGIAKVTARGDATTRGWVKGKIPYMSPEQARGEPLDARSDLFSLGIVVYELATARRFVDGGEGDVGAVLARMRAFDRPSFEGLPAALVEVLERALAADPAGRFQTAREMRHALVRAIEAMNAPVSSDDLRRYLAALELPEPLDAANFSSDEAPTLEPRPTAPDPVVAAPPAGGRSRRWRALLAPSLALLAGASFGGAVRLGISAQRPETRIEVRSDPPGAIVTIDGRARGPAPIVVRGLSGAIELRIEAAGRAPFVRRVDLAVTPDLVIDAALAEE